MHSLRSSPALGNTAVLIAFLVSPVLTARGTSADSLFKAGDYAGMLREYLFELEKAEHADDPATVALASFRVGRAHYYLQNKGEAINWFRRCVRLASETGADTLAAKALRSIGAIHWEQGQADSADHYLSLAEPLLMEQDDPDELATFYAILFELHFRSYGDVERGRELVGLCEHQARRTGDPSRIAFALMKKGILLMETGQCAEAQNTYREGERLYREVGEIEGVMYALNSLASAQTLCHDAERSMQTLRTYNALRDSVFTARTADRAAHYQTVFETQRREIENLALRQRNQLLLLAGIAAVLLVAFASYALYKRRERARQHAHEEQMRAEQRQRFLEVMGAQEAERARIAADLHDGIGHLLGAIKLTTSVLHGRDESEQGILERSRGMIDDAAREVRQVSHRLMPRSLEELGLVPALCELAERISGATVKVSVVSDCEEHSVDEQTRIALYRITQEVLNNMLKHAEASDIKISLERNMNDLVMTLADNGKGFDTASIEESTGLGWRNIRSRVELVGGRLEVYSSKAEGTTVRVTVR